jgi:hypothetical protein
MSIRARKLVAYFVAVLVLLAVFALYTRPQMMVRLADLFWSCFN